jgi:hypothetical protein
MRRELLSAIRSEGGLLPADLLARILDEDKEVQGVSPESYHLGKHEKINEAVSRSWNRLLAAWMAYRDHLENFDEHNVGTSETRERWLYLVFQELGYGRLNKASGLRVEDKDYPISHLWNGIPMHLMGAGVPLDRRTRGVVGAASTNPHSLVQEFLNRSEQHLWGLVSNGLTLRILRDNVSLTRQAYVEFDLEAIFQGEAYTDFKLFWMVCHQSRLEFEERPDQCWLEKWSKEAQKLGTRALESLREGVQKSIEWLGRGFLAHPANTALREDLRSGRLDRQDYFRQLLRLVYRLLFLFVAEDRGLLLDPSAPLEHRLRYLDYYSTARLRDLAERRKGGRHSDLYQGVKVIMECLGRDEGCRALGLYPLGSFLWSRESLAHLSECQLANSFFLQALKNLAFVQEKSRPRRVDYKNLGPEELGSVYESLLEQHPQLHLEAATFELGTAAGNERKSTGSYYTPPELVQCLLDTALEPVVKDRLEEARKHARAKGNPIQEAQEKALLDLSVCDPACGSGHFLIAAAHRLAHRLASVRSGDTEPAPEEMRRALRDVIRHCIYGVDLNPMAVELCKVSLWMESLEPTKPFPFLDSKILRGNSLLGSTPFLLSQGIPDDAFQTSEGDEKKWVAQLKKKNARERHGYIQGDLFNVEPSVGVNVSEAIDQLDDTSLPAIREIERRYLLLRQSDTQVRDRLHADTWCTAFAVEKSPNLAEITHDILIRVKSGLPCRKEETDLIGMTAQKFQFFHWHLAFPTVFDSIQGAQSNKLAGFDVVVGNPPWEKLKLEDEEYWSHIPEISRATTQAQRKSVLENWEQSGNLAQQKEIQNYRRALNFREHLTSLVKFSGRFPNTAKGDLNTYALFFELNLCIVKPTGRVGCVVPTGMAVDDTYSKYFSGLIESGIVRSFYDFENRAPLFPGIKKHQRFSLITLSPKQAPEQEGLFGFDFSIASEISDRNKVFKLNGKELRLLNPATGTLTLLKSAKDANLLKKINGASIPLRTKDANPWVIRYCSLFHGTNDSGLFRTAEKLATEGYKRNGWSFLKDESEFVALFDAKMARQYSHRAASLSASGHQFRKISKTSSPIDQLQDPYFLPEPLFWVPRKELDARLSHWSHAWLIGFKDVTGTTSTRLAAFSAVPRIAANNGFPLLLCELDVTLNLCLLAILNSVVVEYILRQRVQGLHLNFYILDQVPVLRPQSMSLVCNFVDKRGTVGSALAERVIALNCNSYDLQPLVDEARLGVGVTRYDPAEQSLIRAELEAIIFKAYGLDSHDIEYIFESLPKIEAQERRQFGHNLMRDRVLDFLPKIEIASASAN